ncbi:MAG: riboflavin synthase [Lautropia sp.]
MFTGIVAAIGEIRSVAAIGDAAGVRLSVDAGALDLADVAIGDSIAIQGACMTVVAIDRGRFEVDVSRESLEHTVGLDAPGPVNLEKALRLADRLGGHLVSGHVDGTAEVATLEARGESWLFEVRAPRSLARYFAYKGSVAVNGVSLTVNEVRDDATGCVVSINLIPHTIRETTLHRLRVGDAVNVEVDTMARYIERLHVARGLEQGNR